MTAAIGSRRGGFTLVEVMVATAVLALGLAMIFHSFFVSLRAGALLSERLSAGVESTNLLWQIQRALNETPTASIYEYPRQGERVLNGKRFFWTLMPETVNATYGVYKLAIVMQWTQEGMPVRLTRSAYVSR